MLTRHMKMATTTCEALPSSMRMSIEESMRRRTHSTTSNLILPECALNLYIMEGGHCLLTRSKVSRTSRAERRDGRRAPRSLSTVRCHRLPQSPPTPTGLLTGVLVKVGYAKYVRPRSGENFGVVAALVKPPAAVAASTGREREGKRAPRSGIFFQIGLYL